MVKKLRIFWRFISAHQLLTTFVKLSRNTDSSPGVELHVHVHHAEGQRDDGDEQHPADSLSSDCQYGCTKAHRSRQKPARVILT